jgi:hypothetical protein
MEAHKTNTFWQRVRGRLLEAKENTSADVTLYDCSGRFGRTMLEEKLGFREGVAEAVINHADPGRNMRRRYNVSDMRSGRPTKRGRPNCLGSSKTTTPQRSLARRKHRRRSCPIPIYRYLKIVSCRSEEPNETSQSTRRRS